MGEDNVLLANTSQAIIQFTEPCFAGMRTFFRSLLSNDFDFANGANRSDRHIN
jgi:hypothetical protein